MKIDRRLRQTMAAKEAVGGERPFDCLDELIEYKDVSFHYRDDGETDGEPVPALAEVNVILPAHKMSALVGPSGAGKSTFVDLLPRLRDPTDGEILLDGVPIADFAKASLRAGIAFVPQEPQIFDISAAEHIRYGKEDATDAEVREAARLAGALEFIEAMPDGFDTLLGDGGSRLSGGQRQRLDIARALVRRAPILVLDEPTSALDADAETAFRDALRTLRRETDLTIIVIAHRLSTIADAENIVVLRRGRVEAVGTHEQLLKDGGWYASAYRQQVSTRDAGPAATATAG
jgi:ABC-type multidrug transport system fused ATPase/permease subunit